MKYKENINKHKKNVKSNKMGKLLSELLLKIFHYWNIVLAAYQ